MAVKVVFSDGSKALAHNLDDLRERWMIRRSEIIKRENLEDTPFTENHHFPKSMSEAIQMRQHFADLVRSIEIEQSNELNPPYKKHMLKMERSYYEHCCSFYNACLAELNQKQKNAEKQKHEDRLKNKIERLASENEAFKVRMQASSDELSSTEVKLLVYFREKRWADILRFIAAFVAESTDVNKSE